MLTEKIFSIFISNGQEEEQPTHELVNNLISTQNTLDTKMAASKLSIFQDSSPLTSEQVSHDAQFNMPEEEMVTEEDGRVRRKAVFKDDEEADDGDSGDEESDEDDDDEVRPETCKRTLLTAGKVK